MGYAEETSKLYRRDFESTEAYMAAKVALSEKHGRALCKGTDKSGWPCLLDRIPGRLYCWQHDPKTPKRVIGRLTPEEIVRAAEIFARGATGQQVGDELGLTAQQALNLKKAPEFPRVEKVLPEPADREYEVERVGIIKTSATRWAGVYGPIRDRRT